MPVFPDPLLSPGVMRSGLYSSFMDIYLPKSPKVDQFGFFQLAASSQTDEPCLLEALDALSLVAVGSVQKDRKLLTESVVAYGRALRHLSKAVVAPNARSNDDLLAATTVLSSCALYEEIGQHAGGWGTHVTGCQQLIAARGPETLKSELAMSLYATTRYGALCFALIERRAPLMAMPRWREVAMRGHHVGDEASVLFYDAAIQVPGLLERHDELSMDEVTTETAGVVLGGVEKLLLECSHIEIALRDWFTDWQTHALLDPDPTNILPEGLLYSEQPIDFFPTFLSLVPDRTFPTAFTFPDFATAYLASLYWLSMYYLRSTIQPLHRLRHDLDRAWYPDSTTAVSEPEILDCISNLCRCIPYFAEPVSSSGGHIAIFLPMRTAAIYFTTHGLWQQAKWVGMVKNGVFTKGLAPPDVKGLDQVKRQGSDYGRKGAVRQDWRRAFWEINQLAK